MEGTNSIYYAIEAAMLRRVQEANEKQRFALSQFLKRELTVEQTKELLTILERS